MKPRVVSQKKMYGAKKINELLQKEKLANRLRKKLTIKKKDRLYILKKQTLISLINYIKRKRVIIIKYEKEFFLINPISSEQNRLTKCFQINKNVKQKILPQIIKIGVYLGPLKKIGKGYLILNKIPIQTFKGHFIQEIQKCKSAFQIEIGKTILQVLMVQLYYPFE